MSRARTGSIRLIRQPNACLPFDWQCPAVQAAVEEVQVPHVPELRQDSSHVTESLAARIQELEHLLEVRTKEAYRRGQEETQAALKKKTDEALQNLKNSIEDFDGRKRSIYQEAESSLVQLALAIARRVLHRELTVSPEALQGLVSVALERVRMQELLRIHVHSDKESAVRQALSALTKLNIEIVTGDHLPQGCLQIETRQGCIDASVETQLAEIERGLADHLKRLR